MEKHRFYLAEGDAYNQAAALQKLNYEELDPCFDADEPEKVFVDTQKKQFWFVDEECLASTVEIIKERYDESFYPVTLNELLSWSK